MTRYRAGHGTERTGKRTSPPSTCRRFRGVAGYGRLKWGFAEATREGHRGPAWRQDGSEPRSSDAAQATAITHPVFMHQRSQGASGSFLSDTCWRFANAMKTRQEEQVFPTRRTEGVCPHLLHGRALLGETRCQRMHSRLCDVPDKLVHSYSGPRAPEKLSLFAR